MLRKIKWFFLLVIVLIISPFLLIFSNFKTKENGLTKFLRKIISKKEGKYFIRFRIVKFIPFFWYSPSKSMLKFYQNKSFFSSLILKVLEKVFSIFNCKINKFLSIQFFFSYLGKCQDLIMWKTFIISVIIKILKFK